MTDGRVGHGLIVEHPGRKGQRQFMARLHPETSRPATGCIFDEIEHIDAVLHKGDQQAASFCEWDRSSTAAARTRSLRAAVTRLNTRACFPRAASSAPRTRCGASTAPAGPSRTPNPWSGMPVTGASEGSAFSIQIVGGIVRFVRAHVRRTETRACPNPAGWRPPRSAPPLFLEDWPWSSGNRALA